MKIEATEKEKAVAKKGHTGFWEKQKPSGLTAEEAVSNINEGILKTKESKGDS